MGKGDRAGPRGASRGPEEGLGKGPEQGERREEIQERSVLTARRNGSQSSEWRQSCRRVGKDSGQRRVHGIQQQ